MRADRLFRALELVSVIKGNDPARRSTYRDRHYAARAICHTRTNQEITLTLSPRFFFSSPVIRNVRWGPMGADGSHHRRVRFDFCPPGETSFWEMSHPNPMDPIMRRFCDDARCCPYDRPERDPTLPLHTQTHTHSTPRFRWFYVPKESFYGGSMAEWRSDRDLGMTCHNYYNLT